MQSLFMIFGIILGVILLGGFTAMLIVTVPLARKVYFAVLVRSDKAKWAHVCSAPENEEQLEMWNTGCDFASQHTDKMHPVSITNDGLKLFGELYDFGREKCVIILPGRCECLKYSYYYAIPYIDANCSVLVVDSRGHGNSDGKFSSAGIMEAKDALAWIDFLIKEKQFKEIYIHGICVGAGAGILALSNESCPKEVKGMISDGCFTTFRETFKRHMLKDNRPLFPVLDLIMLNICRYAGVNVYRDTPMKNISKLKQKILFICGTNDIFSLPKKSKRLFEKCGSEDKKIIWMNKGAHSHLRINNTEKYDIAVKNFLAD